MKSDFGRMALAASLLLVFAKMGWVGQAIVVVAGLRAEAPAAASAPSYSAAHDSLTESGEVWFANCAEVKKAGVAPLSIGQPGYRSELDDNLDGIACDR